VHFNFELYDRQLDAKNEDDWADLANMVIDKSEQFAAQNNQHHTVHTIIEFIYKKSASAFKQVMKIETIHLTKSLCCRALFWNSDGVR